MITVDLSGVIEAAAVALTVTLILYMPTMWSSGMVPPGAQFLHRWGLRWSNISKFMRLRISQLAASIPLIGYLLLWSEQFKQLFALQNVLGAGLWFDTTDRLLFVYYGAIVLAAAWLTYQWFCPSVIKRHPSPEDYLAESTSTNDPVEFDRIRPLAYQHLAPTVRVQGHDPVYAYHPNPPPLLSDVISAKQLGAANDDWSREPNKSVIRRAFFTCAKRRRNSGPCLLPPFPWLLGSPSSWSLRSKCLSWLRVSSGSYAAVSKQPYGGDR